MSQIKQHLLQAIPADNDASATIDDAYLDHPELYLNRELTWLSFNRRVLHEADDPRTPLLERVKFLAIVSSNLDEFFMKRVGGLKQQIAAGVTKPSVDGRTPAEQLNECLEVIREMLVERQRIYREVNGLLAENNILITTYQSLNSLQQAKLREHFRQNIFPMLTPLAMDPSHPFPFISNLSNFSKTRGKQ
ncbi:hypothetical protein DJ031_08410 [bacterium endosymbiont of Escarpia laminata]|nr:MAG: hypothetical protein DJ031_08410 [bacterium endosymbiont of Escarpia laminata]